MKLLNLPYSDAVVKSSRHMLKFPDAKDRADFFGYDTDEQENVRELHDAMMRIAGAPNPNQGCKAVADLNRGREGWSKQYLRTLFDEWNDAGRDWRWLVDERRYPDARGTMLTPAAQQWVRDILLANQRKFAPAIRKIQAQWRAWWRTGSEKYAIPGFVNDAGHPQCPPPDAGYLPRALQDHNIRRVKIDPAVVEMVRYGSHAARNILPYIPGTRDGVRWLEYVSGDDMEQDICGYVPGFGKCRVLQFGFWDLSCSYYLPDCFIQRPRTPNNDGTWDKLKQRDFLFSVALLIERNGWPLDWKMHLLCERGTATMSRAKAQMLYEISEGQIIVGYSSMEGEFVAAWEERKAGNSRAKAGHEGYHGILKNEMGHLRGQQGMDRDHAQALDYGREKVTARLDNAVVQLPPDQRDRIIPSYLTMPQVWRETFDAIQRIHHKPDHKCEGFELVVEWRPIGFNCEPRPMDELPAFLAANPTIREQDIELFDRFETRAERQRRLSADGRFMAPPLAAMVPFYEDNCEMKRIGADYSFSFDKDGRKHRFVPPTPDDRLPVGEKVVGFYRPDGEVIHLFSGADGKNRRYLLTWPSEKKLRKDADADTRGAFFSRKQAFFDHTYAEVTRATAEQVQIVRDEAEHNALVIAENNLLPANVQRGCTPTAAAVQDVTVQRDADARAKRKQTDREARESREAQQQAAAARAARARDLIATD